MNALGFGVIGKGIQDTLDTGADFIDYAPGLWPIPIPNSINRGIGVDHGFPFDSSGLSATDRSWKFRTARSFISTSLVWNVASDDTFLHL
jgi:hypothetical protein